MKLLAFVVRDEKSEAFAHPFFTSANGLAVRMFGDWCTDANTPLGKHPEDYTLFRVGSWDDEQARFENEVAPVLISHGSEFNKTDGDLHRLVRQKGVARGQG